MSLTREDMLRELELLPVWRQRETPGVSAVAPELAPAPATPPEREAAAPAAAPAEPAGLENTGTGLPPAPAILPATLPATTGLGRHEAIMQMGWQDLQECVAHCEACVLSQTRTQTVFGVGDPHAEWLFVGEAPGAEEDRKGEPFVGQAGKLLDNMLAAIQLKRGQNVYIANVLKCRPPENRDPQGEEVSQCAPFLKRQVELIKPKLIIALGKIAAQSLLGSTSTIAALRGKQHDYHGVPVIVTYHPAYLLRNLSDKAKAWEDLCYARSTMQALQSAAKPQSNEPSTLE